MWVSAPTVLLPPVLRPTVMVVVWFGESVVVAGVRPRLAAETCGARKSRTGSRSPSTREDLGAGWDIESRKCKDLGSNILKTNN